MLTFHGQACRVEEFILDATVNKDGTVSFSVLLTHDASMCRGRSCVIHRPSDHHMRGWRLNWRDDIQLMERVCSHGVGHPDPDQLAWERASGRDWGRVHGCDSCCHPPYECVCIACEKKRIRDDDWED